MQHRQRALEFLLRRRRTRGLEEDFAKLLALGFPRRGSIVLVSQHAGGVDANHETDRKHSVLPFHKSPPYVDDRAWAARYAAERRVSIIFSGWYREEGRLSCACAVWPAMPCIALQLEGQGGLARRRGERRRGCPGAPTSRRAIVEG